MNRRQFLRRTASGLIITVTPTIFLPAREVLTLTPKGGEWSGTGDIYLTMSRDYSRPLLTDTTDFSIYVYGWREGQTPLITNGRLEA